MPRHRDGSPSAQGDARELPASGGVEPVAEPGRPARWAAVLVLLEVVVLLVWAAVLGALAIIGDVTSRPFAAALAGTVLLVAVLLGLGARALRRGHRAARGPLLTWHLLQAATATASIAADPVATAVSPPAIAVSALAIAVSGAVIALLLAGPRPARGSRQPPAQRPAPP